MKYILTIECECGNKSDVQFKREVVEYEGKIYEDYSSIGESIKGNKLFSSSQGYEDVIYVKCSKCGHEHELHT